MASKAKMNEHIQEIEKENEKLKFGQETLQKVIYTIMKNNGEEEMEFPLITKANLKLEITDGIVKCQTSK